MKQLITYLKNCLTQKIIQLSKENLIKRQLEKLYSNYILSHLPNDIILKVIIFAI